MSEVGLSSIDDSGKMGKNKKNGVITTPFCVEIHIL